MTLLFWAELRRSWAEYLLASLAIALVVGALVAQRAITASADDSIHGLAHQLGNNMLVLPSGTDPADFYGQRYGAATLSDRVPEQIRSSSLAQDIQQISPRLYGNAQVNGTPTVLMGLEGRWPATGDADPALVGAAAARRLGLGVGSSVQVGGQKLTIVGVTEKPPDNLDDALFVPLPVAQRALGHPGEINALRLGGCWCRLDVATLAAEVEKLIPGSRAITVAGMVKAQTGTLDTMKRYSSALLALGLALVGGVVATLVSSQARRHRRELGLLVAMGAPPWLVAWAFAVRAALAGALGALVGGLLAMPAARHLGTALVGLPLTPPSGLVLPAVLLSLVMSGIAALLPARRAAALEPIDVLREI